MARKSRISETEWQIMEVLWHQSPLSASEVHQQVEPVAGCHVKTVRTLLERLQAKGAVDRKRVHGIWVFFPTVERESCLLQESRSFLSRFFGADPVPLLVHLVENEILTKQDVDRLARRLAESEERDDEKGRRR